MPIDSTNLVLFIENTFRLGLLRILVGELDEIQQPLVLQALPVKQGVCCFSLSKPCDALLGVSDVFRSAGAAQFRLAV